MKRFLGVMLAAGMLLMGCGKQAEPQEWAAEQASKPFESQMNITYGDIAATAYITKESPSSCTLLFASPPSLKDMAFVFMGEEVTIAYKEMRATVDPKSTLGGMTVKLVLSAINEAAKGQGVNASYEDNVFTVTGQSERGEFILTLDGENGNILRLSIPEEQLEIEFFNFTILSD